MIKKCFKCEEVKPLEEFYRHSAMKDGYLNKCKDCAKTDSKKHRSDNLDRCMEYDRNRPNKIDRYKLQYEYNKTEKGKEVRKSANMKYRDGNKIKRIAHTKFSNALRDGVVVPPDSCSRCGSVGKVQGHHDDYEQPLNVRWLCLKCHTDFHREVRRKERELVKSTGVTIHNNLNIIKEVASWYW